MKYIVAVTIFAACLGAIECSLLKEAPILLEHRETCRKSTEVSDEILERAIKGDMQEDDRNLQCYTSCMLKLVKALDDSGAVDFTSFISNLTNNSQTQFGPILRQCQNAKDDADLCRKGMNVYVCLRDMEKEKFEFA